MQNSGKTESEPTAETSVSRAANRSPSNREPAMPAGAGMVLQLADGRIEACNPRAEELLGLTATQLCGKNSINCPWQTVRAGGSDFPGEMHPAMVALQTGQPCLNEVMGFYRPNGELIWLHLNSQPLFRSNESIPYAVVTTFWLVSDPTLSNSKPDRSTEKNCAPEPNGNVAVPKITTTPPLEEVTQETVRQQLSELKSIYETAPIGLAVLDRDLRFVRINLLLAEINGFSVEEHIGRSVRELLPDLAGEAEPLLRRILETGEPIFNLEISGETASQPGVRRTWRENWYPHKDAAGEIIGINIAAHEITDCRRMEASLRQSEERIKIAQQFAGAGLWDWALTADRFWWSEEYCALCGIDPSVQASYDNWLASIAPADRKRVDREIRLAIQNRTPIDTEFRIPHPQRGLRWF
ncbi:MAG: PAS domain-containing protein, partial [Microcoleus sp.]